MERRQHLLEDGNNYWKKQQLLEEATATERRQKLLEEDKRYWKKATATGRHSYWKKVTATGRRQQLLEGNSCHAMKVASVGKRVKLRRATKAAGTRTTAAGRMVTAAKGHYCLNLGPEGGWKSESAQSRIATAAKKGRGFY